MKKNTILLAVAALLSLSASSQTLEEAPVKVDKEAIDSLEHMIDQKEQALRNTPLDASEDLQAAKEELNQKLANLESAKSTLEKLKLKDVVDPKEIRKAKSHLKGMKKDVKHATRKVRRKTKVVKAAAKAI